MKSLKYILSLFVVITLAATGCSDDNPAGPNQAVTPATPEAYQALIENALASRTQTANFNAEDGISFTSEKGVKLNFPGGCLTLNGNPVNGPVKLTYIELFNKGDMVVTNKPTMGLAPNGDKKMLVSGGEFYINMTKNGKQLDISCGIIQLRVPGSLTGGVDKDMILWNGIIDANNDLTWKKNKADSTHGRVQGKEGLYVLTDNYLVLTKKFGWTNVDRFYSDPRPKTMILVRPPKGYDNTNSTVFLSYDNLGNALAQLDRYLKDKGLFSEHYGQIPIGLEMHIIFVTEKNGQWRYAIKGATVAEGDLYSFTLDETVVGSEQDLINAIKALP